MSMTEYQGYPFLRATGRPERKLPVYDIRGTAFYVDLQRHEFRQVDNPVNRISLGDAKEEMGFSHLLYDTRSKNIYLGQGRNASEIPDHVYIVLIPSLKELDPVGLARLHGYKDDVYSKGRKERQHVLITFSKNEQRPGRNKSKGPGY